ncbi:hypothetical protein BA011_31400 (plasmid) [Rhizobium leguminosarum]|uniref:Uncharacterized protein n=1 Tax=Rhizobium leguminosarum TaxID=384 RepID=A0A1B1CL29_RHILE|nr:hypothetical protein BA011_31400 [Rhizobium leguminosarum]
MKRPSGGKHDAEFSIGIEGGEERVAPDSGIGVSDTLRTLAESGIAPIINGCSLNMQGRAHGRRQRSIFRK